MTDRMTPDTFAHFVSTGLSATTIPGVSTMLPRPLNSKYSVFSCTKAALRLASIDFMIYNSTKNKHTHTQAH